MLWKNDAHSFIVEASIEDPDDFWHCEVGHREGPEWIGCLWPDPERKSYTTHLTKSARPIPFTHQTWKDGLELRACYILVGEGGYFQVGSRTKPMEFLAGNATLTWKFNSLNSCWSLSPSWNCCKFVSEYCTTCSVWALKLLTVAGTYFLSTYFDWWCDFRLAATIYIKQLWKQCEW